MPHDHNADERRCEANADATAEALREPDGDAASPFTGWMRKWFSESGDTPEPCPWCGELAECTPHCRSQYPDGVNPETEEAANV